jgi:hypothetical protein
MAAAHCHSGIEVLLRASRLGPFKSTTVSESSISRQASLFGIIHAIAMLVTMKRPRDNFVLIVDEDTATPAPRSSGFTCYDNENLIPK